jgi:DNA-binding LacI/PurR family transcriptional regulator
LGRQMAQLLVARIHREDPPTPQVLLGTRLIRRVSA